MRFSTLFFSIFLLFFYSHAFRAEAQVNYDSLEINLTYHFNDDSLKVVLLTDLAKLYLQNAVRVDTARVYIDKGIEIAQKIKNYLALANAMDTKGIYERNTGRYYTAIYYHEQALEIALQFKNIPLEIITRNNIGVAFRRMGDNATALPYHQKALELARNLQDKYNISYGLNCLGNLYYQTNEFEKSLYHFKQAYQIDTEIQNWTGIAVNHNNVGGIFRKRKHYDSALFYFNKSLEVNSKIRNIKGMAICYDDLGLTYSYLSKYSQAIDFFKRSLQIANASKDRIYVARVYMHIGMTYIDMKMPKRAIYYLTQSIGMARIIRARNELQESHAHLSRVYKELGDYKLSLENYETAMRYKDTLINENKAKETAYLQAKFENEQKDILIKVLKQENTLKESEAFVQKIVGFAMFGLLVGTCVIISILFYQNKSKVLKNKQLQTQQRDLMQQKNEIQQQKDELDRVNVVKDRLFSIIGHDLRSPFNTIKGFIAIMRVGGLTEEEIKNITITIEQQLNSTLNLLNNLLYWSWSQMQGITANPADMVINPIIENNINLLLPNAIKKNIQLHNCLDKKLRVKADENMIDTIIRNLLANAIKFTYHNGEVKFSYKDDTDRYIFCVSDTGVGMTETQLKNLFDVKGTSTFGTAHEKGTGLGLQICKEFLERNHGTIWVESEVNKGSSFYFTLPKE
jgi:two-component system sensor histidine kinase/response regulator